MIRSFCISSNDSESEALLPIGVLTTAKTVFIKQVLKASEDAS